MQSIDKRPIAAAAGAQAVIVAAVNLAASFGLVTISNDQLANLNAFLALALPMVLGYLIRNKVIPAIYVEAIKEDEAAETASRYHH